MSACHGGTRPSLHPASSRRRIPPKSTDARHSSSMTNGDLDKAKDFFDQPTGSRKRVDRATFHMGRTLRAQRSGTAFRSNSTCKMDRLEPIHQQVPALSRCQGAAHRSLQLFLRPMSMPPTSLLQPRSASASPNTPKMTKPGALWAVWMHRKGGVHDIAFTNGRGPRLHHTAFWVAESAEHHRPARSSCQRQAISTT